MISRWSCIVVIAILASVGAATTVSAAERHVELAGGRLLVDGEWTFLKVAKVLRDLGTAEGCEQLIGEIPVLKEKGYNAIAVNLYWHHYDKDGDGAPDVSLEPLARAIREMHAAGMFPAISTEIYGVGGGTVPAPFWERHPEAIAVNSNGEKVMDTEYGFGTAVPSFFSPDYLAASRAFIRNITAALPHGLILYYETSVEPQYIGNQAIDFSEHARNTWETWRADNPDAPEWPGEFPVPKSFLNHPEWNRFRAVKLAEWVNGDAAAFRSVAGADALVAVDYLETNGPEMARRNGDSRVFLRALDCANIIQVNWHWHLGTRAPNQAAYDNLRAVMRETGRDWAISEHMTLNGSDYSPEEAPAMLRNALAQGTGFGWEFVHVTANSRDPFSHYNDDWSPKPLIAVVDNQWDQWAKEIAQRGRPAPATP